MDRTIRSRDNLSLPLANTARRGVAPTIRKRLVDTMSTPAAGMRPKVHFFCIEQLTMSDSDDLKQLKEQAAAAGLTLLTDEHLKQLQRAVAGSRRHKANLTIELSVSDEPAHVYSLVGKE